MATKCLSLIKGRRIRVTRLDDCGRPVYGEDSQAVSSGFISVALTANTTDSDEISVTNAAGEICVFEPSETSLTGYGVEITFCQVDPELFALITGQEAYVVGGDALGFTVNSKISGGGFALELWAGAAGGDACTNPDAEGNYGYLLLPFIKGGIVGDFTIENAAVTFTITGGNTADANNWGVGPYDDVYFAGSTEGPLPNALDPNDHVLMFLTNAAPPDAECGTRPLLDPSTLPALTSITATEGGDPQTAGFEATPASTGPIWWDFGDGTWDYVDAPGSVEHVYAAAGTYTVTASNNGTWVSTTVTVPFA